MQGNRIRWSAQSLDELVETYWSEIAPAMRRENLDPDEDTPTHQWLSEQGFRGLEYALRVRHDLTLSEFFTDVVGIGDAGSEGYEWQVSDDDVVDVLEAFVRSLRQDTDITEQTVATKRSRLATYARTFDDCHGAANLITDVDDASRSEAHDSVVAVFEDLDRELTSAHSKIRYHADVEAFYDYLQREGVAAFNPAVGVREKFDWANEQSDSTMLSTSDVRALYEEAASTAERVLVVAVAGWGLRTGEVASLHRSDVDESGPQIEFKERAHGPATVPVNYGVDELTDLMEDLAEDSDWSGYLFPSTRSESGHVSPDTVRERFKRLGKRADVRVRGEIPTPKMGRRTARECSAEDLKRAFGG